MGLQNLLKILDKYDRPAAASIVVNVFIVIILFYLPYYTK